MHVNEPIIKEYVTNINNAFRKMGIEEFKLTVNIKEGTEDLCECADDEGFPKIKYDIVIGEDLGSDNEKDVIDYLDAELGQNILTHFSYWFYNEEPGSVLEVLYDEGFKVIDVIQKVIKKELKREGINLN
jgi:hypothetical protein